MQLVATGNRAAQKALVLRLSPRVSRTCRSLAPAGVDADDLVQVALIEVLGSAGGYQGLGSLERWADRIVIRSAMQILTARRRTLARVDDAVDPELLAQPPGESLDESIPRSIEMYLADLPGELKTLIVLRHVYEYTIPELCELTHTSVNTIKKRLLRANQLMRSRIRRDRLGGGLAPDSKGSTGQ